MREGNAYIVIRVGFEHLRFPLRVGVEDCLYADSETRGQPFGDIGTRELIFCRGISKEVTLTGKVRIFRQPLPLAGSRFRMTARHLTGAEKE